MQTPDWAPHDSLPPEWGGLYAKDCIIGGPEDSYFFTVRNSKTNTRYEFIHITYPPSLNKKPKAEVYTLPAQVWQNKNNPDHYLLYSAKSFRQILVKDGWSRGLHQTLDGKEWDIMANGMTKYKPTDAIRWGAYLDINEDFGSRPPCDAKLAQPWTGVKFKTKSGKSYTLDQIMGTK